MRGGQVAVCFVAFACSACAGGSAVERNGLLQATYGAYGQPAGYYPGRAEPFGGDASGYSAWLATNRTSIDDIQNRIAEIRIGRRQPGCIGEDRYTCVATLSQKLAIADQWQLKDFNVFTQAKVDVNGRPVDGNRITFEGYPPNVKSTSLVESSFNRTTFFLTLGKDGSVTAMDANLPKDPIAARTQEEYDATDVYESVWAVTAKSCPTLSKADVAKWIENTIKPASKLGPKQHFADEGIGVGSSTSTDFASKKVVFCGRTFQFHSVYGVSHKGFETTSFGGMTIQIQ